MILWRGAAVCLLAWGVVPATEIELRREVVNLESYAGLLERSAGTSGDVWSGVIPRRVSGKRRDVPFVVEFRGPDVVRARADVGLDGGLDGDADLKLSIFPGEKAPGRSFLVPLKWTAKSAGGTDIAIDRLVRVVIPAASEDRRGFRLYEVYGRLGSVDVQGASRLALLFDGDFDGLYTKGSGDGIFVDLDGDKHFPIDIMAPEFGPFGTTFSLGRDAVIANRVDVDGSRVVLEVTGAAPATREIVDGSTVPDFMFVDADGGSRLLSSLRGKPFVVYFWSSECDSCRKDAEGLQAMYERFGDRVEILGVSYDAEREAMERFRRAHGLTFPTSFTGGPIAADPTGRLFREAGTGIYYVIDAEGRLSGKSLELADLNERLTALAR